MPISGKPVGIQSEKSFFFLRILSIGQIRSCRIQSQTFPGLFPRNFALVARILIYFSENPIVIRQTG